MQAAIQNAAEIQAVEIAKQTAYSKEIAKNTHKTATAAQASAYHTRQIDKNANKCSAPSVQIKFTVVY